MLLTRASLGACYKANTGETMQPRTQIGYGVLVCLRRKQPNTLRLTSRAFRGINRRCRYTFIAGQGKKKSTNRTPFQVFDLGFYWCTVRNTAVSQPSVVSLGRVQPAADTRAYAPAALRNSIPLRYITKNPMTNVIGFFVVHRKEFESLAFGSVDQRSIQLS